MSKELLDLDDFEIIDLEGNKTELDINVNEVDNQQNEQQQIPLDQRSRIVNEIFETEENYVEGLKLCIKYYYEPLMENNIIPRDKLEIIFLHFPDVCKMNSTFFEKLQSYKKDGVLYGNIGSAFVEFSHFFKVYKMVVGNSEAVLAVLKDVCSSQQVSRYLEQKRLRINAKSQLDLRSYLITPVQRLPRYNLLLNELLKHTEEEHPDYANIIEAIKCIKECTQFANDSVRERERRDKLITISQAVEGASSADIVKPNRVFLKSGHLIEIGKKVQKKRFFYLFTDLLMYGNGDEKKLTVLGMYNIESLIVKDVKDSPNSQHCFRILNLSNSEVDLTLRCDGEDSKKNWMNILTTAVQDERSRLLTLRNEIETSQTMVWIPDEEANECMRCGAQFTLFFRKHHCRNCGYVICSNCRERCKIPKLNRVDYVCTKCYSEILQDSKSSHPSQPSSSPQPNSTPQQPSPQNIADTTSSPDHSIPHENPSNTPQDHQKLDTQPKQNSNDQPQPDSPFLNKPTGPSHHTMPLSLQNELLSKTHSRTKSQQSKPLPKPNTQPHDQPQEQPKQSFEQPKQSPEQPKQSPEQPKQSSEQPQLPPRQTQQPLLSNNKPPLPKRQTIKRSQPPLPQRSNTTPTTTSTDKRPPPPPPRGASSAATPPDKLPKQNNEQPSVEKREIEPQDDSFKNRLALFQQQSTNEKKPPLPPRRQINAPK